MCIPEAFIIVQSNSFDGRDNYQHQASEHDITSPARTGSEVSEEKPFKPLSVLCRKLGEVVPMCDCVKPGEEYNGPSYELVKGDGLVKFNDSIEGSLSCQRDERAANRENKNRNIKVKNQRSGSGYRVRNPESGTGLVQVVLHVVVYEPKCKNHAVHHCEHEHEEMPRALVS